MAWIPKYAQKAAHSALRVGSKYLPKAKASRQRAHNSKVLARYKKKRVTRKSYGKSAVRSAAGGLREKMVFSHGHKSVMAKSKARRIIESITPVNTYLVQSTSQITVSSFGQCNYGNYIVGFPSDYNLIMNLDSSLNQKSAKAVLRSQSQTLEMVNMSNTTCYARVYEYVFRHDLPAFQSGGAIFNSYANFASNMIQGGFADAVNVIPYTTLSSTIYENPSFCSWCKVINQRMLEFSPGQVIQIDQFDQKAKSLNANIFGTSSLFTSNPFFAMKGYTKGILIQVWGQPVDDTTTNTQVSTDKVKLSVLQKVTYKYQWVLDANPSAYIATGLGSVTTAQSINELADGVVTSTTA